MNPFKFKIGSPFVCDFLSNYESVTQKLEKKPYSVPNYRRNILAKVLPSHVDKIRFKELFARVDHEVIRASAYKFFVLCLNRGAKYDFVQTNKQFWALISQNAYFDRLRRNDNVIELGKFEGFEREDFESLDLDIDYEVMNLNCFLEEPWMEVLLAKAPEVLRMLTLNYPCFFMALLKNENLALSAPAIRNLRRVRQILGIEHMEPPKPSIVRPHSVIEDYLVDETIDVTPEQIEAVKMSARGLDFSAFFSKENLIQKFENTVENWKKYIEGVFSCIAEGVYKAGEMFYKLLDLISDKLTQWIAQMIKKVTKDVAMSMNLMLLFKVLIGMVATITLFQQGTKAVIKLITNLLTSTFSGISGLFRSESMVAMSCETEQLASVISFYFFNVDKDKYHEYLSKLRGISMTLGLATTVGFCLKKFLTIMPYMINWIIRGDSNPDDIEIAADRFIDRAKCYLQVTKLPNVAVHPEYRRKLDNIINDGTKLLKRPELGTKRSVVLTLYTKLITQSSYCQMNIDNERMRITPFVIHLTGGVGIGKSLMGTRLIRDFTNITQDQIYSRPINDEFWSGAHASHRAIIFDEFCENKDQNFGSDYIVLCSPNSFKPAMPTLDNANIGIKGTSLKPEVVLSISNHRYPTDSAHTDNSGAMDRRRDYVIEARVREDYQQFYKEKNMNLQGMDVASILANKHLEFAYLPKNRSDWQNQARFKWVSYETVLKDLRTAFARHRTLGAAILAGQGVEDSSKTPEEIINSLDDCNLPTMATFNGIGNVLSQVKDAVCNLLPESMSTRGKSRRKRDRKLKEVKQEDDDEISTAHTVIDSERTENTFSEKFVNCTKELEDIEQWINSNGESQQPVWSDETECSDGDFVSVRPESEHSDSSELWTSEWWNIEIPKEEVAYFTKAWGIASTSEGYNISVANYLKKMICVGKQTLNSSLHDFISHKNAEKERAEHRPHEPPNKAIQAICINCNLWKAFEDYDEAPFCERCKHYFSDLIQDTKDRGDFIINMTWIPDMDIINRIYLGQMSMPTELNQEEFLAFQKNIDHLINGHVLDDMSSLMNMTDFRVYMTGLMVVIPAIGYLFHVVKNFFFGETETMGEEPTNPFWTSKGAYGGDGSDSRGEKGPSKKKTREYQVRRGDKMSNRGESENPIARNIVRVQVGTSSMYGIIVKGKYLLSPYHLYMSNNAEPYPQDTPMSVYDATQKTTKFDPTKLTIIEEQDLAMYDLSEISTLRNYKDITSRFMSEYEVQNYTNSPVYWVRKSGGTTYTHAKKQNLFYNYKHEQNTVFNFRFGGLGFTGEPKHGECGTPLIAATTDNTNGKILGVVVAGSDVEDKKQGGCAIVTKEIISQLIYPLTVEPSFDDELVMTAKGDSTDNETTSEESSDAESTDTASGSSEVYEDCGCGPYKAEQELASKLNAMTTQNQINLIVHQDLPNKEYAEQIAEEYHIPRVSKLKPTTIAYGLPKDKLKYKPIMSVKDERAHGEDPVYKNIHAMLAIDKPEIPMDEVDQAMKECLDNLKQNINFQVARELTLFEAINGIPGKLKSINLDTSAGYPLILTKNGKPGKTGWIERTEQGYVPTEELIQRVEIAKKQFENGELTGTYIGFLKDEPVSLNKIKENRTRIIWCGDLVANLVFRMKYGGLLTACLSSWETTSICIGLNQYSHDMDTVKRLLDKHAENTECEVGGYIAGDYKDYDKRYNGQIQQAAYRILMALNTHFVGNTTFIEDENFIEHQTRSPYLMGKVKFQPKAYHASGCFFTTPVNSIYNELLFRIVFNRITKGLTFERNVGIVTHGDDHILKPSQEAYDQGFNPVNIQKQMNSLGQIYTSDVKGEELTTALRPFDQITFLGAHPRKVFGLWSGAMKLDSVINATSWKSSDHYYEPIVVDQVMDMYSQHSEEEYEEVWSYMREALEGAGYHVGGGYLEFPGYHSRRRAQCERTCSSGLSYKWFACSEETPENPKPVGLTGFSVANKGKSDDFTVKRPLPKGMTMGPLDSRFAVDSSVYSFATEWTADNAEGEIVAQIPLPWGLLDKFNPETTNMQDLIFKQFALFNGDVQLEFKINGTPFQQGLMLAYFRPWFDRTPSSSPTELTNKSAFNMDLKVEIKPTASHQMTMTIPFRHPRDFLNTSERTEGFGYLYLQVISPLKTGPESPNTCTVSVFASFPNANFSLPKPNIVPVDAIPEVDHHRAGFTATMSTRGNTTSTTTVENTYVIEAGGSVPVQTTNQIDGSAQGGLDGTAEVIVPLDNPPWSGGGAPVASKYPSISKTYGLEPTNIMSLHPAFMARRTDETYGRAESETNIDGLMKRTSLAANLSISTADPVGNEIGHFNLGSWFNKHNAASEADEPNGIITLQEFILSNFVFWRGDFEFIFKVIKTPYHSMSLKFTAAYAVDVPPTFKDTQGYISTIMDFSGEKDTDSVFIGYNAATEFLRSFEGTGAPDQIQDHSLGFGSLFIQNPLRCPDSVSQSVDILVCVRMHNVRVSVPRAVSFATIADHETNTFVLRPALTVKNTTIVEPLTSRPKCNTTEETRQANWTTRSGNSLVQTYDQSTPTMERVQVSEDQVGEDEARPMQEYTEKNLSGTVKEKKPCTLQVGERIEFVVRDLMEVIRRPNLAAPLEAEGNYMIEVRPQTPFIQMFSGWRGGIKFRIFFTNEPGKEKEIPILTFYPTDAIQNISNVAPITTESLYRSTTIPTTNYEFTAAPGPNNIRSPPMEIPYETSSGTSWIDVIAPFVSHKRFLSTVNCSGLLMVKGTGKATILVGGADDLTLGTFLGSNYVITPIKLDRDAGVDVAPFAFGLLPTIPPPRPEGGVQSIF